jgi:hypothetical protein
MLKILYHKYNCGGGCKHVFPTDWTITFQITFNAFMIIFEGNGHTDITFLAMKVILTKSLANPANSTVMAVINILTRIIVP